MRVDPVYRSIVNADFSHVEYHYQMVQEQISSSQPIMVLKYTYTQMHTLNNSLPTLHGSFDKSNQTSIVCSPKTYPWLAVLVYSLLQRSVLPADGDQSAAAFWSLSNSIASESTF